MNNPIKQKKQINKRTFDRLSSLSDAIIVSAYYRYRGNFYEAKYTSEAFLLGDFVYCKVDCKKLNNNPPGTVRHTSAYMRYNVTEGFPRADEFAFVKLGKLNVF